MTEAGSEPIRRINMKKTTVTIEFDPENNDYIVDGRSLLEALQKHESVDTRSYIPAVFGQPLACERLLGDADPDLQHGHTAIFLCSHCGGYDGSPIGVKVDIDDDTVSWKEMGYFSDLSAGYNLAFHKIREFNFDKEEYDKFIAHMRNYEIKS